jgi:uncharacterized phage-associated protein
MGMFRSINNEKIGYILNYLSSHIEFLSMTKALKLLYIIDETSIKETGSPITWLDYKVWEMGPVAVDIYNEIKRKETILYQGKELTISEYIDLNTVDEGRQDIYLKPKVDFNDKIFNQYELNLLVATVSKFGKKNAQDLINYLHEENSLWHKTVQEHNLEKVFATGQRKTNYSIEFTELIQYDPILVLANKAAQEALEFQQRLSDYGEK